MTTISDSFTGGYDTSLWQKYSDTGGSTFGNGDGNQFDVAYNGDEAGLVTKTAYNMAAGSSVSIDLVSSTGGATTACGPQVWLRVAQPAYGGVSYGNIYSGSEWYRLIYYSGSWYAQKFDGTTHTTIGSGLLSALPHTFEISLPTSGAEVRFLIDGSQVTSDATYALSTRNVYILIGGAGNVSSTDTFDTFSATYSGGGTTYNKSLTGNSAAAGIITKSTSLFRNLSSLQSNSSSIKKSIPKPVGSSANISVALIKKFYKTASALPSTSASIIPIKAKFVTLSGIQPAAVSLIKNISSFVSATNVASGLIYKKLFNKIVSSSLSGANISPTKVKKHALPSSATATSYIVSVAYKKIAATVGTTATIIKSIGHFLQGTISVGANIIRRLGKQIGSSSSATAAVSPLKLHALSFAKISTIISSFVRQTNKSINVSASESVKISKHSKESMNSQETVVPLLKTSRKSDVGLAGMSSVLAGLVASALGVLRRIFKMEVTANHRTMTVTAAHRSMTATRTG